MGVLVVVKRRADNRKKEVLKQIVEQRRKDAEAFRDQAVAHYKKRNVEAK